MWRHKILRNLLIGATAIAFFSRGAAEQTPANTLAGEWSNFWDSHLSGQGSAIKNGELILQPADASWAIATAFSRESFRPWTPQGVSISFQLDMKTTLATPRPGEADMALWIGFCTNKNSSTIQRLENFSGLSLGWSKKDSRLKIGLALKEANGANQGQRGDAKGNIIQYSYPVKTIESNGKMNITLSLTESEISVSTTDGTTYTEKRPNRLTREFWQKAYFVTQCMNFGEGRGRISIKLLSAQTPDPLTSFRPLDLSRFANMGFKDAVENDNQGGWTDQGLNDLRHLKTGRQKIRGIPFAIIEPSANGGKSCLMLYSPNRKAFPKEIGPVLIGEKADALIFLHGAAWATQAGTRAATYKVIYTDKSAAEIPIVCGAQVNDWWGLQGLNDPCAGLFLKIVSDKSARGVVGLYGYCWKNPHPEKELASLSFIAAGNSPVLGVLGVSLVPTGGLEGAKDALHAAFRPEHGLDLKLNPPDKAKVSDRIRVETAKRIGKDFFSVGMHYCAGGGGMKALQLPSYAGLIKAFGGIARFPHGRDVNFYFWPYQYRDWRPVLGDTGGPYGEIAAWVCQARADAPNPTLSYQDMLDVYKKLGLKLILTFNTCAMFDGAKFVYVKTLPEAKMRRQHPLADGIFSKENLDRIVAANATLVDYVIKNGYEDTVAYWEMDNERWDMKGAEYAETVAAHLNMLRTKIPKAKVIVCISGLERYSVNPEGVYGIGWNRELLTALKNKRLAGKIDCFAPHIYPFLSDKIGEITENYLQDYCVRDCRRFLDTDAALLQAYGFGNATFYVSEWGQQSDGAACDGSGRNDLVSSMAAALGTAKTMMAIASHPKTSGMTFHPFFSASFVDRSAGKTIRRWGCQTVYLFSDGRLLLTPPAQAIKMFVSFAEKATLLPVRLSVPPDVQFLCAQGGNGSKTYYVVNSSSRTVSFPVPGVTKRKSLFAPRVTDNGIIKYGSFGDRPGDIAPLVPRDFSDAILPPYSINVLRESRL